MRGCVKQAFAHGFRRLCLAQDAQSLHPCCGFEQKKKLFQRTDFFCPCRCRLTVAKGKQFHQRRAVTSAAGLDEQHAIYVVRFYYIRDEAAVQNDSSDAGAAVSVSAAVSTNGSRETGARSFGAYFFSV